MSRAYGWADDGDTIVDDEAHTLRTIATTLLDGGTLRGIMTDLNTRGILTATGKQWQTVTIKRALTNPRIIGKRLLKGHLVDTSTEPILDVETYDKIAALLLDPARDKFIASRSTTRLLSGGIARCGKCGRTLHADRNGPAYRCSPNSGCGGVSAKMGDLDAEVTERVLARLTDPGVRRDLTAAVNALHSPGDIAREIADLEVRLVVLGEDYADGTIARSTLKAGTERIKVRIENARLQSARRAMLLDLPEPDAEQIVIWWEDASVRRRRDVVGVFLDHVTVMPASRGGARDQMNPDRLRWVWLGI